MRRSWGNTASHSAGTPERPFVDETNAKLMAGPRSISIPAGYGLAMFTNLAKKQMVLPVHGPKLMERALSLGRISEQAGTA